METSSRDSVLVAGVDGCTAGWVAVTARCSLDGRLAPEDVSVARDFRALLAMTAACAAVAVDVLIGLSEDGRRAADFEARRCIGPRRSSVFPPPARALVTMDGDFATLNAASKLIRAGISQQTYNILPKIRDADRCMTPELQARVTESHPEVSFWALNAGHLLRNKRHREGRSLRLALLEKALGPGVRELRPPAGAAWDDLFDAAVLAWTASRVARGVAERLPPSPEYDARGLRMEIVY